MGQRIRAARLARRWSQRRLAAEFYIDQATICRWENGVNVPTFDDLAALAPVLGVHPAKLFPGESPPAEVLEDVTEPTYDYVPMASWVC